MSGRLIGPKTWNQNVKNLWNPFGQSTDYLGALCDKLCINSWFGVYEVGNGHGIWFHKEEPMLNEWVAHGQPTYSVLGL